MKNRKWISLSRQFVASALFAAIAIFSVSASAVEYYELEVYGYQTANRHELELENTSSVSSDSNPGFADSILRSSFEFNYGLTDRWEVTAYFDYTKPADNTTEFTAFRTHARTNFFEEGELPVDLGAYIEAEFPRNFRAKDVGLEFRPIIEKDVSRWVFRLNPAVELAHVAHTTGENSQTVDPDGDVVASSSESLSADKTWTTEWNVSGQIAYTINRNFRPHLDWHEGLTDQSSLVMPGLQSRLMAGVNLDVGAGFGLNSNTESRLFLARIEFESFLE